jgi:hypothetical protein
MGGTDNISISGEITIVSVKSKGIPVKFTRSSGDVREFSLHLGTQRHLGSVQKKYRKAGMGTTLGNPWFVVGGHAR